MVIHHYTARTGPFDAKIMTTLRCSETLRDDIDYGAGETPNSEIALRLGPLSDLLVSGAMCTPEVMTALS